MTHPHPALPGDEIPARTFAVTRADLRRYADASGDRNPIHLEEAAARALGLPDVVAHGMLTAALAVGVVAEWAGGADRVLATDLRFAAPLVVPEDGGAALDVSGVVRSVEPADDEGASRAVVALSVTSGGSKVLGKAMVTVLLG